ncbi:MAG: type I pantothenate kinase [Pseudomonadota bacterium]
MSPLWSLPSRPDEPGTSPYRVFSREEWAALRADTPMVLSEHDLSDLSGILEELSIPEVEAIYLPMSRLVNLYVTGTQNLYDVTSKFLGTRTARVPFILGVAGSVAVGKSTMARVLQSLLRAWPDHPRVELVTTDGFLLDNATLEERGLMNRKGFPESYDSRRLRSFLAEVKAGRPNVQAPVYSHFHYDVQHDTHITVDRPDILIVEGLNVLQPARLPQDGEAIPFVSDFFDFSIYLDASSAMAGRWYVERFMKLRSTAFRDPAAYFHRYAHLAPEEARATAEDIWDTINLVNLRENILPTRQRADLIVRKARDHSVEAVALRKL